MKNQYKSNTQHTCPQCKGSFPGWSWGYDKERNGEYFKCPVCGYELSFDSWGYTGRGRSVRLKDLVKQYEEENIANM